MNVTSRVPSTATTPSSVLPKRWIQALDPGDEAGLECRRIKRTEDQAELVVARRAILKRQETAQKRALLLTKRATLTQPSAPQSTAQKVIRSTSSSG